jgi:predicted amidohydrolase
MSSATPKSIRVAAAQYPIDRFATLDAYKDKLARWVGDAAHNGAQLLVFPEYAAMEYSGSVGDAASDLTGCLAATADAMHEMGDAHAALARQHGAHILAASGPLQRANGGYTNAARLYAPSGSCGTQHKCMMTPFERTWGISAGTDLQVFDTALGKIGIAICYDSEFPLLVHAMAAAGADFVLVPSCTEFISGANRVRTAALARALENGCAIVTSPTVGDAVWSPAVDHNTGRAGIYVPSEYGLSDTGILAEGELNRPMWVYADIDLAHLHRIRTSGEMQNAVDWDRQPGAGKFANVEIVILNR